MGWRYYFAHGRCLSGDRGLSPMSYGFSFIHSPRLTGYGGGVGLMYRSYLNLSRLPITSLPSFEAIAASFKISSSSFTILNIYRPPSLSVPLFLSDIGQLLESLVPLKSDLIITGDFSIHINQKFNPQTISFTTRLLTFALSHHVSFKTHTACYYSPSHY